MTRKDWLCPQCGNEMVKISDKYITCLCGNTRLFNTWSVSDLPMAVKLNARDFRITYIDSSAGKAPRYQYVSHGHKAALEKAPPEGCVVASVAFRGHRAVRLFRQRGSLKTLRERLVEHHFSEFAKEAEKEANHIRKTGCLAS